VYSVGTERLQAEVARLIGGDAALVIRVALQGFSQAEAGRELGLTEAASRKRNDPAPHMNVALPSVELNLKVASVDWTHPDGPESIDTFGGVVSIVQE
jgi:hypothetical protein